MLANTVVQITYGLTVFTALITIVFAIVRGRRLGAGLAFGIGGLMLLLYAGGFLFSFSLTAKYGAAVSMARSTGRNTPESEFVERVRDSNVPLSLLEPVAVLMLALGFGALARASDEQVPAMPPGTAPEPVDDTASQPEDEPEDENDAGDVLVGEEDPA